MERQYPVFILDDEMNDDDIGYYDAISWCYDHLDSKYVLVLSEDDVNTLVSGQAVEIINDENSSMIGLFEDDWISSNSVKKNSLDRLKEYVLTIQSENERVLVLELIRLFELSIKKNKYLYFAW